MARPIWQPSEERIRQANMTHFLRVVREHWVPGLADYRSLYEWSIRHPEHFWPAVWSFCDIKAGAPWEAVVVGFDRMPGARWFVGSRLNFAENLLRHRDDRPALVFWGETGKWTSLSYAELYTRWRGWRGL